MRDLFGKVAVVTGAGSGIGQKTSLELAHRGCHLALVDLTEAKLEETAKMVRALGQKVSVHGADVSNKERMSRLPTSGTRRRKNGWSPAYYSLQREFHQLSRLHKASPQQGPPSAALLRRHKRHEKRFKWAFGPGPKRHSHTGWTVWRAHIRAHQRAMLPKMHGSWRKFVRSKISAAIARRAPQM